MSLPVVNIGLLGFGTVGCGVIRLLQQSGELLQRRTGLDLRLRRVADLDLTTPRPVQVDPSLLVADANVVLDDPEIQIIIEVVGGVTVARDFVLRAIANNKSVVTSNKELIAKHGGEIMDAAGRAGVDIFLEGSVGGGIPLIGPLKTGLVGNRFSRIMGIVNGTTNYILTAMTEDRREFDDVLREAQQKGYAEADPTADVDGWDSLYKIVILATLAYGQRFSVDQVARQGIRHVTSRDIEYAENLNYTIKLLAKAEEIGGTVQLEVHPCLVPKAHPLAGVGGVYNAIMVEGDAVGRVMFYGRGAGSDPTGSAVVADVVEAARNVVHGSRGRIPCRCSAPANVRPVAEIRSKYCVRMNVADRPKVLAQIAGVFGDNEVSLASVVQLESTGDSAEIVLVTHEVTQKQVDLSLCQIGELGCVSEVCSVLHVEEE
ncbi:MAG: homoserine dehydrogenase [Armatimonadetes bacterium CG_4_10_14_3_um_filter_66_18]|nr:homoserine dehydrogenase [Armatimonadota bacterium]OIP12688.1 MAG: homoserine dehydrogenase [Armatimonadetes bacterium CG2_30_66_41]PIU88391.1 MAG: homoserine dehydrogenase [Armatimonadetes bacterium CG06_land_8_20_14_3_00_66_21]PIX38969.1 MAG: homoserine dehydrogenase [Armatimonadetes bacterium CG_4_8_14_3_um_filter_66_20]PIY42713.1 MAG: homoserine dehydrogenase [Armatimonadetes bacterium CG_4_10_14_3_um_filter_66_18]PIZ30549.1 MAG: homoserine dehydrogenase [Armatimonadetes bacterium CG_4_